MTPERKGGDEGGWARGLREAAPQLGLGTALALTVFLSLWGGHWLDQKLGTDPVFFLLGGVFGVFAGLYHFYKKVTGHKR